MASAAKIVVRAPQWLGDAVVSTYFLSRLKEKYSDSDIHVAGPVYLQDLYQSHPAVAAFIPLPNRKSLFESVNQLRAARADRIYILPRSFRTALEARLAPIPERIGFSGDLRRFLLTEAHSYRSDLDYPHRYLKLLGDENLNLGSTRPFFPKVSLPFNNLPDPILGLGPASIAPSRTWPVENFIAVAKAHLASTKGSVVLFGSNREKPVTQKIRAALGDRVLDTAGQLSLPQLGGLISLCRAFVCNDSGLMHVASAFQVPTVVVFGASDPTYALPRTGQFRFLQSKKLDCVPCLRNHCVRVGQLHEACLKQISPEEVLGVLKTIG
jgi:heptosyltransferase-2